MKNLTWQNPGQLFVAQELIKIVKLKCCGIKDFDKVAKGDLMQKAINYMHTFWEQLFRYRNDGNYTIDNSLAERSIRPMTVERKNSLFFCSKEGAKASAIFHTIIETCKQLGLSAREYIKNFLKEVSLGRTDWQNLTPAKIYL